MNKYNKQQPNILFGTNGLLYDSDDEDEITPYQVPISPKSPTSPNAPDSQPDKKRSKRKDNFWTTPGYEYASSTPAVVRKRKQKIEEIKNSNTDTVKYVTVYIWDQFNKNLFKINGCPITFGNELGGVAQDPTDKYLFYEFRYDEIRDKLIVWNCTSEERPPSHMAEIARNRKINAAKNGSLLHPSSKHKPVKKTEIEPEEEITEVQINIKIKSPKPKKVSFV